jgi:multicomponent Na+:H+ antiporter subunit G
MIVLSFLLAACAIGVLLIAALGILRLPDALSRQHAATKAGTLAVTLFALALLLFAAASGWGWDWAVRLLALIILLFLTLPLASHALARTGAVESSH